jgi:hypothetical protein
VPRRADAVRLSAPAWPPGAAARVSLSLARPLPAELEVCVRIVATDGRTREQAARVRVERAAAEGEQEF